MVKSRNGLKEALSMESNARGREPEESKTGKARKGKSKILVVGDLFIDENWLMARCDNYHSTNPGRHHYTSLLSGPDSMILSLCGVASVMKILRGPTDNSGHTTRFRNQLLEEHELVGVGAWNPADEPVLKCILCPRATNKIRMTPYTLAGISGPKQKDSEQRWCPYQDHAECSSPPSPHLVNLIEDEQHIKSSTNRLFRIYEGYRSDKPKLLYRFDWKMELDDDILHSEKLDPFKNAEAVVIVDHGKGVIRDKVIERLCNTNKNAKWYVRLKLAAPAWLRILKENGVKPRLIVSDQQVVDYQYGIRNWRHGQILGRGSLEILGDMLGLQTYEHGDEKPSEYPQAENTAILFVDNSAIAASRIDKKQDAAVEYVPPPQGDLKPIRVGRTSVFFISLIYRDLYPGNSKQPLSPTTIRSACEWALSNVYKWTQKCTGAWVSEKPSGLSGPFHEVITWGTSGVTDEPRAGKQEYVRSWDEWNHSSKELGIVPRGSKKSDVEVQLWRAYGTLPSYVCPGGRKRSEINRLIYSLNGYVKKEAPEFPFNCLFLVSCPRDIFTKSFDLLQD
jgi:hypothetical protein